MRKLFRNMELNEERKEYDYNKHNNLIIKIQTSKS